MPAETPGKDDSPGGNSTTVGVSGGPTFVSVPCEIMRTPQAELSFGAKCLYGRLHLYGRKTGVCNPSHATLAGEIGVSDRHVRKLLNELQDCGLVTWKRTRSSARYTVMPPAGFHVRERNRGSDLRNRNRNRSSNAKRNTSSGQTGTTVPTTRGSSKEVSPKEEKTDSDCLPTNRKKRDSRADVGLPPSQCKQYLRLRELLAQYMMANPTDATEEKVYPTDRLVVEVMDASGGAGEEEVIACLRYHYNERGLRPGTENGPRHFSWFPTVVQDYFDRKNARQEAANPSGYAEWQERNEARMTNEEVCRRSQAFDPKSEESEA